MIWISLAVVLCAALSFNIIRKIEKTNDLIRSQCLDIFNLHQTFGEFRLEADSRANSWGSELRACILTRQAMVQKDTVESPLKRVIEKKAPIKRRQSAEAKRKQSERMKVIWAEKKEAARVKALEPEKKKESVRTPSFFNNYMATDSEGSREAK